MTDPPTRFIDKESYNQAIQDVIQTITNMPSLKTVDPFTLPETILRDHKGEPTGVVLPKRSVSRRMLMTTADIIENVGALKYTDLTPDLPYQGSTPHAVRLKLDKRIHSQRRALRNNWMIVRDQARGNKSWLRSLFLPMSELCDTFEIPEGVGTGSFPIFERMRRLEAKFKDLQSKDTAA